jgi:hypothetical protein
MDEDSYVEIYSNVFNQIRDKFSNSLTLLDSTSTTYIDTLNQILSFNEDLKEVFFSLKSTNKLHKNLAWLPIGSKG